MQADFNIINISGRQRMLSQKIALLAGRSDVTLLNTTIDEFEAGLDYLLKSRFVSQDYQNIYELYKKNAGLEQLAREYITLTRRNQFSEADRETIFQMSQALHHEFDKATLLKQTASEAEFNTRFNLEIGFFILTCLILLLEILYIFRPMKQSIINSILKLIDIEEKAFTNSRLALIGETAANIGHEIKNPLNLVHVTAQLLMRKDEENKITGLRLLKSTEQIQKIIKFLSTQSRDASQDPLTLATVKDMAQDALEMFAVRIKTENVLIIEDYKLQGEINCRQAAVSQVLANLVANALDAMAEAATRERVITIHSGQDSQWQYIRVQDSGKGVPKELQEKIFESFVSTKKAGKGTGLGLSISRKIMQEHGGNLLLNSEVSNSCFELRFPQNVPVT